MIYFGFIILLLIFVGCNKNNNTKPLQEEKINISPQAIASISASAITTKSAVILEEVLVKENTSIESIGVQENALEIIPKTSFDASEIIEKQKQIDGNILNSWNLILINPENKLPEDFTVRLASVTGGYQLDERIANIAKTMVLAAKTDGVSLQICSAFRTIEKQTILYNNKVKKYQNQGMSLTDAKVKAATIVAVPGTSEHNSGLALDIITESYQTLDAGFANTRAFRWLETNASEFGFIMRYPKDKQDITKIIYEPWHYRYIGIENAIILKNSGLSLEEFLLKMAK